MYIESISITRFAGLSGVSLDLTQGLNVLEGNNESGKSSIAECIRFLLYGFQGKADRERYFGLTETAASGSLVLSDGERRFRVERKAVGNKESCEIYDLASGGRVFENAVPGELFFGIPAGLFVSTVFVGQTGGGRIDGRTTAEAVDNLLFSASEGINIKKTLKRLDEARIELLHKNGKGGKIYEMENALSALRSRLCAAEENSGELLMLEAELSDLTVQLESESRKLEEVEKRLADYRLSEIRKRDLRLASLEGHYQELTEAIRIHRAAYTRNGFFPDAAYLENLRECGAELARCDETIREIEGNLEKLNRQIEAVRAEHDALKRGDEEKKARLTFKRGTALAVAILGCVLFLFCAAVTAVLFLTAKPTQGQWTAIGAVLFLGTMIGGFVLTSRYATAIRMLVRESDGREEVLLEKLDWLREDLQDAKTERENYKTILDDLSRKWNLIPTAKALTELKTVLEEDRRLEHEQEKARVVYVQMKTEVESARQTEPEDDGRTIVLPERFDPKDTERRRTLIAELIRSKTEIRHKRELRHAELSASAESPAVLSAAIRDREAELAVATKKYRAYALAAAQLAKASETMRAAVSPRLADTAGHWMAAVTDGKYGELGVDGGLAMTFRPEIAEGERTTAAEMYMSAGTADVAYVSLRLALASLLCGDNLPPMLFDESFARLDDIRLGNMLRLLAISGGQVLLFSSCGREAALLQANDIPYFHIAIGKA